MPEHWRPAWAGIDLDAVRHNASLLAGLVRPSALCAVVKADGYGHGAPAVARAALEGGATWLAVALVEEGVALREAGIDAPVLLLSEAPAEALPAAVAHRLVPTVYTHGAIGALAKVVSETGAAVVDVHLKVDTGMHRVGADPSGVRSLVEAVAADAVRSPRGALDPPGGRRRRFARGPRLHRRAARSRFDAVLAELDRSRTPSAPHPRGQLRRHDRVPGRPPRPGPLRDRALRVRTEPGARRRVSPN